MNSIAPLIEEAERIIAGVCEHHGLKVKPKQIVVTIQTRGKKKMLGWYWKNRWANGVKDALHEINIAAETIKTTDIGELLIHELAHAENAAHGVKDCSKNQVHNKKFKERAESLGLIVKDRDERYGFAFTELGPESQALLKKLAFKPQLFQMCRLPEATKEKKGSRLRLWMCQCGTKLRVAKDDLDVTCNVCETVFEKQEPEETEE